MVYVNEKKEVSEQHKMQRNSDITLKLAEDIKFSMTQFDKINKGLINSNSINCYMNVCI